MLLINGAFGFTDLWTVLSFTYTAFVVVVVLSVIADRREPVKTLAWIMLITLFPIGGVVLFFMFGRNHRKGRIFMQKELFDNQLLGKICGDQLRELPKCDDLADPDKSLIRLMLNNSHAALTLHNRVEIRIFRHREWQTLRADV